MDKKVSCEILKLDKQFSEEQFMRQVYIDLSAEEKSPLDILSSKFGEITEGEGEVLVAEMDVDITFSCMIGKNRQEEYIDRQTYYENGIQKTRDVKKTRTVTDWSPFQSSASGKFSATVENADKKLNFKSEERARAVYRGVYLKHNSQHENVDENFIANPAAIARLQEMGKRACMGEVKLPGDTSKDLSYSGTAKITKITKLKVPEYSVNFEYNGSGGSAKSFASGEMLCECTLPESDEKDEQAKLKKKKKLSFHIPAFSLIAVAIVFTIISTVVEEALWATFISIPCFLVGVALLVGYFLLKYSIEKKIVVGRLQQKKKILEEKLKDKGYQPLSALDEMKFKNV